MMENSILSQPHLEESQKNEQNIILMKIKDVIR